MYEKQFQFRGRPFCCIPSAEHYFPASSIDAALESIKMCIDRASGPAMLFGQSGLGKSQLLAVLNRDYKHHYRVVNVLACTRMSRRHDLLQNILFELGQPYRDMSEGELRLALIDYLKPSAQCPNGLLLLVDDGYTLPYRLLDELRMITNFVRDGQARVRMVIAGTQALEEKLTHPQLESLNQRIAARCYLQSLRRDEVEPYIRHQVVRAGCPNTDIFQSSAIAAVAQLCEGNPRTINQICDHALILAASCGQTSVNGEMIAEAFSDIQRLPTGMWIPALEPKSNEGKQDSDGTWAVVEFGQIADATNPSPSLNAVPSSDLTSTTPEASTAESISESIDVFTKMVDSLASLDAESTEDESMKFLPDVEDSQVHPSANPTAAYDPFAEPFAEEYSIHDNYAQLAARQNRSAMQMTEHDISSLELHLQQIDTEVANATAKTGSSDLLSSQIIFDAQLHSEPTVTASIEFPIVDHDSYQMPRDDADVAPQPANQSAIATDDRDMLVISQIQQSPATSSAAISHDIGGVSVTRGHAVRLEYGRLFQQLRGADAMPQPPTRK